MRYSKNKPGSGWRGFFRNINQCEDPLLKKLADDRVNKGQALNNDRSSFDVKRTVNAPQEKIASVRVPALASTPTNAGTRLPSFILTH